MNIEKIAVNGHYVWVDKDAEIKEGDMCYLIPTSLFGGGIGKVNKNVIEDNGKNGMIFNKIIAADAGLELDGVPTYVEFLSNEYNKTFFDYDETDTKPNYDFISGYKAAEKELPTWADVRKAIQLARVLENQGSMFKYSEAEIIEKLKQSKTK